MGAGKGEIARMLGQRGFKYISLSDFVRREASARGIVHTREALQDIGNELRKTYGAGVLGRRTAEEVNRERIVNWVIDGIRNPSEVHELQKLGGFYLLGLTADREVLVQRLAERGRESEKQMNASEIAAMLDKENGTGEEFSGQQIGRCLEMVDFLIINSGTFTALEQKLNHFLGLIAHTERSTFDEIFMEIAYVWAQRATCLRRRVGAVIAKDSQQLTTGYNGAPKGLPHCAELGGCLREKLGIPSGQRHELCRGTHAEQNAITQAAKLGINIEGGTLYCNTFPCVICTKMILNAGIKKLVYDANYDDPLAKEFLNNQKTLEVARYEGKKFR